MGKAAFAEGTTVSVEKTVSAIVSLVRKHNGSQIAQLDDDDRFVLAFTASGRQVRFTVNFPAADSPEFARMKVNATSYRQATATERTARWEARRRQRMRALLLVIRAKFESVTSEVETFEEAFLANVVTHGGLTVYEKISEQIALEYQTGRPSALLLGAPS